MKNLKIVAIVLSLIAFIGLATYSIEADADDMSALVLKAK